MYEQNSNLKTEVNQLKLSKLQLSNSLEKITKECHILTQQIEKSTYVNEAEGIMGQLEEILTETESNLMKILPKIKLNFKLSFMKKTKVGIIMCT